MNKTLESTLTKALSWANIRELPEKDNGENIWIYALALVTKRDGSRAYLILSKDKKGNDIIAKDFGNISSIVSIDEVYPYLFLNTQFIPEFKKPNKEERIKWLKMNNGEKNYSEMTMKELNNEIVNVGIQNQIRAEKALRG